MRYPASEKLEIIRLVEESALPVRRTLEKIGIPRATFYRWYDLYQAGGPEALDDRHPKPDRVWNRIPDDVRERIIRLALDESTLSPRELAVRFTDTEGYFVSEASVYRLLKARDLIASPAFIVVKAADEFKDKTTAPEVGAVVAAYRSFSIASDAQCSSVNRTSTQAGRLFRDKKGCPVVYATASLTAFTGRALMTFLAGLALNTVGSFVNGLMPFRAFVAGFLMTTNFANPGTKNAPVFLSSL